MASGFEMCTVLVVVKQRELLCSTTYKKQLSSELLASISCIQKSGECVVSKGVRSGSYALRNALGTVVLCVDKLRLERTRESDISTLTNLRLETEN